ncbi:hypothetical protein AGMMS49982_14010 [Bacteroidia bacterium]|nr:hypothetical protein AGMMS49982_14010 [Bacteroidia bacterium]
MWIKSLSKKQYDIGNLVGVVTDIETVNWTIAAPLSTRLNKLKKSNPEAFFYWYKIYEIETDNFLK